MVVPQVGVTFSVHRTKGRIITTTGHVKMIQGVREVFEIVDIDETTGAPRGSSPGDMGKLVFIGRGLDLENFEESLNYALDIR